MKNKTFGSVLITLLFLFVLFGSGSCKTSLPISSAQEVVKDSVAERMLLYQRSNGGWPQPGGDAINYTKMLPESLMSALLAEKNKLDATIDHQSDDARNQYVSFGLQKRSSPAYLKAAENGINYLLTAQNTAGSCRGSFIPIRAVIINTLPTMITP